MSRKYTQKGLNSAILEAQERHVRIENERIAGLEDKLGCHCASCSFSRLERRIGTREAADEFARSLGITSIDVLRVVPVICEKLHKSSEVASA